METRHKKLIFRLRRVIRMGQLLSKRRNKKNKPRQLQISGPTDFKVKISKI